MNVLGGPDYPWIVRVAALLALVAGIVKGGLALHLWARYGFRLWPPCGRVLFAGMLGADAVTLIDAFLIRWRIHTWRVFEAQLVSVSAIVVFTGWVGIRSVRGRLLLRDPALDGLGEDRVVYHGPNRRFGPKDRRTP